MNNIPSNIPLQIYTCKISSFHGSEDAYCSLKGYDIVLHSDVWISTKLKVLKR